MVQKFRGAILCFGVWADPEAAAEYLRVREYLQAGRLPPATTAPGIRMNNLRNRFLNAKRCMVDGNSKPRQCSEASWALQAGDTRFGNSTWLGLKFSEHSCNVGVSSLRIYKAESGSLRVVIVGLRHKNWLFEQFPVKKSFGM